MSAREEFEKYCKDKGYEPESATYTTPWIFEFWNDAYQAGLEAAAKVCDDAEDGARKADDGSGFSEGAIMTCGFCSTGIRKLKE